MNKPASETEKRFQSSSPDRRQRLILSIVSGAVLLAIAVAILVYLGLRGTGEPAVGTPEPTESVEPTATAFASPVPEARCETIISSGDLDINVALPVSLTVRGTEYPVAPIVPQEDAWVYPSNRSGEAVWVCGTVVNYVVGLEATAENQELLGSLAPGDELSLGLTSNATLRFRFAERRDVAPGAEDALSQQKPRLTLVVPQNDTWQIAVADYAAETESMEAPLPETSSEIGQSVQVGQARVTLTRGYVEQNEELPVGTAYYVTEFLVENVGEAPLATDTISVRLRDSLGDTYLVSPQASEAGESGPLSGDIEPGTSVQGSAGFVVPDPLPMGELTWVFSLRPGSEEIRVAIPSEGGPGEGPVAMLPRVTVNDAFFSGDGSILIIEGEVENRDTQPLIVERGDVILSSSAGTSELVTAAPLLPWTIEPGQTQPIELQYQRPNASTVLIELLGYSFEIGGLQ